MKLVLNAVPCEIEARTDETLVEVLRREGLLSVRGTCGIGVCGTCTVLVDGEQVSGCLTLARSVADREVTTVEGLGGDHPVQRAFADAQAFQCGYCAPGFVLATMRLLEENTAPDTETIRAALAGNLCRCGSYVKILQVVEDLAG